MKFHGNLNPATSVLNWLWDIFAFCKLDKCAKKFDIPSMEKLADRSMVLRELSIVKFGSVPQSLQSAKLTSESSLFLIHSGTVPKLKLYKLLYEKSIDRVERRLW